MRGSCFYLPIDVLGRLLQEVKDDLLRELGKGNWHGERDSF